MYLQIILRREPRIAHLAHKRLWFTIMMRRSRRHSTITTVARTATTLLQGFDVSGIVVASLVGLGGAVDLLVYFEIASSVERFVACFTFEGFFARVNHLVAFQVRVRHEAWK